jgi:hypothetical protein
MGGCTPTPFVQSAAPQPLSNNRSVLSHPEDEKSTALQQQIHNNPSLKKAEDWVEVEEKENEQGVDQLQQSQQTEIS